VTGNTNGIYITANTRGTLVRENFILGNPAIQIGNTHPEVQSVDILNLAPSGAVTFDNNQCVTSLNAPCPVTTRPIAPRPVTEPAPTRPPPQ
jgi:hypothetical protein